MKYDAIIMEGDGLAAYAEPDTNAIRFDGLSQKEAEVLSAIAERNDLFVCLLPHFERG